MMRFHDYVQYWNEGKNLNAVIKNHPPVSEREKAMRKREADFARGSGSGRLEGIILPPEMEELNQRYINGEISSEQLTELSLKFVREM